MCAQVGKVFPKHSDSDDLAVVSAYLAQKYPDAVRLILGFSQVECCCWDFQRQHLLFLAGLQLILRMILKSAPLDLSLAMPFGVFLAALALSFFLCWFVDIDMFLLPFSPAISVHTIGLKPACSLPWRVCLEPAALCCCNLCVQRL